MGGREVTAGGGLCVSRQVKPATEMGIDFSKYYSLEEYLFNEVRVNFEKRGYLTSEEFFCIVIWKAVRAKTLILRKLLAKNQPLDVTVRQLTSDLVMANSSQDKLSLLLDKWKFRLPMASAILTVLYPDDFTIYDVRVCASLNIKDFSGCKSQIDQYFNYFLPKIKNVRNGKTLRENDKFLWGQSFYNDLKIFLNV